MRDFLFVQSKELIRTRHLLILTLMNVREDKIDASVNLVRGFLLRVKKKTKNKKKNEMLNLWIDLENFKVLFSFSETRGNLCDCII